MRLCFDLDETLCTGYPYEKAVALPHASKLLEDLHLQGHEIVIYTARGMGRNNGNAGKAIANISALTLEQLKKWNFIFNELHFGKPAADIYIDDKSVKNTENLKDLLKKEYDMPDTAEITKQLIQNTAFLEKIEASLVAITYENKQFDNRISSMERQLAVSADSMKNFWDREWKGLINEIQQLNQKSQMQLNMQQMHQSEQALLKQRLEHMVQIYDEKIKKLEKDNENNKMELWKLISAGASSGGAIAILIQIIQSLVMK